MFISKSKYVSGCQCPKILWMGKHMPEEFDDSVLDESVLRTGNEVGDLAMGYYGDFVEIPYIRGSYSDMARMTEDLIAKKTPVICEASFLKDGCFCMVDILRLDPNAISSDGRPEVHIVEVKASTQVKDYYLTDVSFQMWLLEECGLHVKSASLMHLNSGYVRDGELDINELFEVEDVTSLVRPLAGEVASIVRSLEIVVEDPAEPNIPIGPQCDSPFECGYKGWCWRSVPKPNVHGIARIKKDKAWDLHNMGIVSLEDVADGLRAGRLELNEKQTNQVMAHVQDLDDIIDKQGVAQFLHTLCYPLYYLDFETIMPAIPPYDGTWPYQQIPTQYSLHWEDTPDGPLHHTEFLAEAGVDPRRAIAERLCEDIPTDACVIAYNMGFEKGRLKELADLFPDLRDHLLVISDNMVDLIVPFRNGSYYSNAMQGSSSIKYVLPALFPDDPELNYGSLEGVHNGGEAMNAFASLSDVSPEEAAAIRESLLRYCELDTYAMVKIVHKLYGAV